MGRGHALVAAVVDEYEAEQSRLQREIGAAKKRIDAARWGSGPRREEAQRELGALVLAVYDELAEIEREHADAVRKIRDDAVEEATRLLEAAREKAVLIRGRATGLASAR